jgi:hypothetical protein
MSLLTTITPYWRRPDSLRVWLAALRGASIVGVRHLIYFVGEPIPVWFGTETAGLPIVAISCPEAPGASIGYYHNVGAKAASSDWIMKLDVDAIPNVRYFRELLNVLQTAREREWFNCGMVFMSPSATAQSLDLGRMPLSAETFTRITLNLRSHSQNSFARPEASNFCCRRTEYLQLGGSDPRFKQWGWEDYQQLYMLERHWRQCDPLPGPLDIANVTQRCRDEIGRPKAAELFARNRWLCLLHRWHPTSPTPGYKSLSQSQSNRQLVLEYIQNARQSKK